MKLRLPLVLVPLLLAGAASLVVARINGPIGGVTGAPALGGKLAEKTCMQAGCHADFAINLPGATLTLLDVPNTYWPDSVYTIRVRMTSNWTPTGTGRRWGFQLVALNAVTGDSAGTLLPTAATMQAVYGTSTYIGRRYVEHTAAGTYQGNNGPVEWAVNWRAPHTNVGRVIFCAAGNASDNSGTNSGDHIYTTRDTSEWDVNVDAPAPAVAALELAAAPNPARGSARVSYSLGAAARVTLDVLDVQGRVVRVLEQGEKPAGRFAAAWDGRDASGRAVPAGVYFARLALPGAAPRSVRFALER